MGVEIIYDPKYDRAVLVSSSSDTAFGPVFLNSSEFSLDAAEVAKRFLKWLVADPRSAEIDVESKYLYFLRYMENGGMKADTCPNCEKWEKGHDMDEVEIEHESGKTKVRMCPDCAKEYVSE